MTSITMYKVINKILVFLTEKKDTPERQTILITCIGVIVFVFFASAVSLDNKNKRVKHIEQKIQEEAKREKIHVNSHSTFMNPVFHKKPIIIEEQELKVLSVKTSHTISTGNKIKPENQIEVPNPEKQNLNAVKLVDTVAKQDSVMYRPRIVIKKHDSTSR